MIDGETERGTGEDRVPAVEPKAEAEPCSIDAADLADLMDVLRADIRARRSPAPAGTEEPAEEVLRAICLGLIVGPLELGVEVPPSPLREEAGSVLSNVGLADLPEARVCRLWLASASGGGAERAPEELAMLTRESLWQPVRVLAYRGLAFYGRRKTLAELLPKEGPLSLAQADAWLEAAHAAEEERSMAYRLGSTADGLLPAEFRDQWAMLLKAETALAWGDHPEAVEGELAALASLGAERPARTYAEAEARRVAARAAAALARARIARGSDGEEALASPSGRLLPAWERHYLRALGRWQLGDREAAASSLEAALRGNQHQSPIRLAMAALHAPLSPEAALGVLKDGEQTREVLTARSGLLARLGRYGEAESVLLDMEGAGNEPARYSWARGREQSRRRGLSLTVALAERRGDWKGAEKVWQSAGAAGLRKGWQEARQLFAAQREMRSLAAGQSWRRDQLKQRLERGLHEIGAVPLGSDALFFRAAAVLDTLPGRAVKDFQALLRRRAWMEAERRAGGGRILFTGDALLRLGQIDDAVRAYERAGEASAPEVKARLAVALVYKEILARSGSEALSQAVNRAAGLAPESPWPHLMAALGLLLAGQPEAALGRTETVKVRGAPANVCHCLRSVCAAFSGGATIAEEDLVALRLPDAAAAVVRLLCGTEPESARIQAFVRDLGDEWMVRCPTDLQPTARRLLTALCDEGRWDEARQYADGLARSGQAWGLELANLMRVRHALERAARGELKEADTELAQLEASLQTGPS